MTLKLDSDAEIEIVPGKSHGDLLTPALLGRIRREMSAAYLAAAGQETR